MTFVRPLICGLSASPRLRQRCIGDHYEKRKTIKPHVFDTFNIVLLGHDSRGKVTQVFPMYASLRAMSYSTARQNYLAIRKRTTAETRHYGFGSIHDVVVWSCIVRPWSVNGRVSEEQHIFLHYPIRGSSSGCSVCPRHKPLTHVS